MGAYDAILGYGWLKAHSPMWCDGEEKCISFIDNGVSVKLQGVPSPPISIEEISVDQLHK